MERENLGNSPFFSSCLSANSASGKLNAGNSNCAMFCGMSGKLKLSGFIVEFTWAIAKDKDIVNVKVSSFFMITHCCSKLVFFGSDTLCIFHL
jgi:hypothetical protein